ncbi:PucR family transcriptional regulator [Eubacterium sp. AB3007]|uniref:PucR family transcriptional regulator n=1 Tax=Eubacterium sp. AB3007 TaxID=1392487 RepID=UPI00047FD2AA|nr:PucR family transcriptional regulator [Eubacterium sp. AB3007]
MKLTVNDCLQLEALAAYKLLAGKRNLENKVGSVSVLDAGNAHAAIEENGIREQLVLTSFSGVDSLAEKKRILSALTREGVSALVLFHQEGRGAKDLSALAVEAEKIGIPLIQIPEESHVRYADVINQVTDRVLYGDSFKNGLINNTIYHLLNFEKHNDFRLALKDAAISNDFQVVLLSKDFNPILTVETRQRTTIADAIRMGKEKDVEKNSVYTFIDVNGVLTYWGPITINGEKHFLFIVDNEDNYSAGEITKLAEIIELAMGMWKFTPERDVRAEFLKALVRNNKSLAYSLKDEMNILSEDVLSVFYAKGINTQQARHILSEFETREHMEIMRIEEDDETYGLIMKMPGRRSSDTNPKLAVLQLFDHLKEGSKTVRIFHATGIDGIEGAADAFRLIGETWTFVESVFPYKRVFTKYELALVINCINLQVQGGHLKKNYMDLLDPFYREMGENKARQLLETLETFVLDAGMNSGKTSTFMGIHTNTVQYRLKRINEVLGAEITGNRVIPGLTMALALKRLERVVK